MTFKNIYIIGAGGIGSHLINPLGKFIKYYSESSLPFNVVIIDGDKVEDDNIKRQCFIPSDVSKKKAACLADWFTAICGKDPRFNIYPIEDYLTPNNIGDIIKDDCTIFVGIDNLVRRGTIEKYVTEKLKNALIIFGGNEYEDGDVNVVLIKNGKLQTPLYSEKHPEIFTKRDKSPEEKSCTEETPHFPQLVLINSTIANIMVNAYYSVLKLQKVTNHEIFTNVAINNTVGVGYGKK